VSADVWDDGAAYESYVGRWSRPVADRFVSWIGMPAAASWLDFGCGSGALTQTILALASPRVVVGCDRSPGFVDHARGHTGDRRAQFVVGSLDALPAGPFDACVAGLVLNFLSDPVEALRALAAVVRPGGTIGAYVWDYAHGMKLMRAFWDAAVALDPAVVVLDEGVRFPICRPDPLRQLFEAAALQNVAVCAIDVPTIFDGFEDYWQPFLGGQGPAPGYLATLAPERREKLRDAIRRRLPVDAAGRIPLTARAWGIRGAVP